MVAATRVDEHEQRSSVLRGGHADCFTDSAALSYIGSLVEGLSDDSKYAVVAGGVTGGGLTIIASVPNPAGIAILHDASR